MNPSEQTRYGINFRRNARRRRSVDQFDDRHGAGGHRGGQSDRHRGVLAAAKSSQGKVSGRRGNRDRPFSESLMKSVSSKCSKSPVRATTLRNAGRRRASFAVAAELGPNQTMYD